MKATRKERFQRRGQVVYEIPSWRIRPLRFVPYFLMLVVLLVGGSIKLLQANDFSLASFPCSFAILMLIGIYLMYTITFSINGECGVYAKGIAPLRKGTIPLPSVPWSVFVPFEDVARMDFEGRVTSSGRTPWSFLIYTHRGRRYSIDAEDLKRILTLSGEAEFLGKLLSETKSEFSKGSITPARLTRIAETIESRDDIRRLSKTGFSVVETGQWMTFLGLIVGLFWAELADSGIIQGGITNPLLLLCLFLMLGGAVVMPLGFLNWRRHSQ